MTNHAIFIFHVTIFIVIAKFIYIVTLQEKRAIAVGAKTASICRLLRRVFGPLLYIRSIAAFYWPTAIVLVFCGVLQWWVMSTAIGIYLYQRVDGTAIGNQSKQTNCTCSSGQ